MEKDLEVRLRTDRAFIEYLCAITGKSASALASGAGMAPTTLNRFLSKKIKLKSTLKDITIQKIANRWGFDYLELMSYRKIIEDSLRVGKPVPDIQKTRLKTQDESGGGFKEQRVKLSGTPERDPLMDQIMSATYDVWFKSDYRDDIAFERLPDLVRLLYGRTRLETKSPSVIDIKKRAADMLAVVAMEAESKKK